MNKKIVGMEALSPLPRHNAWQFKKGFKAQWVILVLDHAYYHKNLSLLENI
jgi:hypothetical protein